MKNRWLLICSCGVLVCVSIAVVVFWNTGWGRAIRGVSRVEVKNMSPSIFDDVIVTAHDAGGRPHSSTARRLEPGEVVRLDVRTSDLTLMGVTWNVGGIPMSLSEGGLACPGETFVVGVFDDGWAKTEHKR